MKSKIYAIAGATVLALVGSLAIAQQSLPLSLSNPAKAQDRTVTLRYEGVKLSVLLEYLKSAGVNYVIESSSIPEDKKFTLILVDVAPDQAFEAIAEAAGLRVSKKNGIFTLSQGLSINRDFAFEMPNWNDKQWREFDDKTKEFGNGIRGFTFKGLPEGSLDLKELPQLKFDLEKLKGLKDIPKFDFKELPSLKNLKEFKLNEIGDLDRLIDSLSSKQWEIMKSKGFLSKSDLTPEQLKMLPIIEKNSKFQITIDKDGRKVTFKGE